MSITAMGAEEIDRKSLVSTNDYLFFVPNVSMLELGPGWDQVIIRGVGTSIGEQSTVSTYFGEVPLTNSSRFGFSTDMKLVDMERVEVLRGPQGTLYGSGALGGTVRNIPVAPNLSEMEVKLDVGYGFTSGSGDNDNKVVGVFNLPLIEDTLALRMSVYRFEKAGYIDLISTTEKEELATATETTVATGKDRGGQTYTGGRANLLWQANEQLSVSLLYATQKIEEEGTLNVDIGLGGYQMAALALPGTAAGDHRDDEFDFVNLVLEYDLGWASLLASSTQNEGRADYTYALDRWVPSWAAKEFLQLRKEGEIHEIRLASQLDGPLQFVSGLYYEDFEFTQNARDEWFGSQASFDAAQLGDNFLFTDVIRNSSLTQKAIFGELIYALNEQWEFTLGGRWYDYDRRDKDKLVLSGVESQIDLPTNEDGATYKANITWSPDDDSLVYAQWSQGFRLGEGQVMPPASVCDIDGDGILDGTSGRLTDRLESDSTTNYELGAKFSLLDSRLILNTSLYRIDWEDIPVTIQSDLESACAGRGIKNNSGEARSQGLEIEGQYLITPGLQVSLSAGYTDAEFLDDSIGEKGQRLPLTPTWNGTLAIEYNWELGGHGAFVRSDYNYRDDFTVGAVAENPVDGHGKWNMRAGISLESFDVEVYGTNLANDDAVSTRWEFGPNGFRMAPRTIGLNVSYEF